MPIPDSGKIAIGVVGALGTIAALHLAIFKDRASTFQRAKEEHDRVAAEYQSIGQAQSLDKTFAFKFTTLSYTREYWDLMASLRITVPTYFLPGPANDVDRQRQDFLDFLADLQRRASDDKAPKLSFVSNSTGWDIQPELPASLRQPGVMEDLLQRLRGADRTLKVLDKTQDLYKQRLAEYEQLLRSMGMDLNKRDAIKSNYGDLAATLYTLNRINLVKNALGPNALADMSPKAAQDMLYELFRMEWPTDPSDPIYGMYPFFRQTQNLRQIFDLAEQAGIQDITLLKPWAPRPVYYDPNAPKPGAAPGATPAPGGGQVDPRFQLDEGNFDPGSGEEPGGKEKAAVALPFQIEYIATNPQSMAFLDLAARSRVPLEVDALRIAGMPQTENLQFVNTVINSVGYIPFLLLTDEMIDRGRVDSIRALVELAQKAGAKQKAIEAGLINGDGSPVVPTPTAYDTPPAP